MGSWEHPGVSQSCHQRVGVRPWTRLEVQGLLGRRFSISSKVQLQVRRRQRHHLGAEQVSEMGFLLILSDQSFSDFTVQSPKQRFARSGNIGTNWEPPAHGSLLYDLIMQL